MGAVDNIRAFTKLQYDKLESIEVGAQKNDVDQIRCILTSNLTLDGTEQQILFNVVDSPQGISMPSNGILEFSRDGYYAGDLNLYMIVSGLSEAIVWVESRVDDLSPWTLGAGLMYKTGLINDGDVTFPAGAKMNFNASEQVRLMIKKLSGNIVLSTSTETVSKGTLVEYPAIISLFRVGNILL